MQITFSYPTEKGNPITAVVTVPDDRLEVVLSSLAGYVEDEEDASPALSKELRHQLAIKEREILELREQYIRSSAKEFLKEHGVNNPLQAVKDLKDRHNLSLNEAKIYIDTIRDTMICS